jgi:hypothetical protein
VLAKEPYTVFYLADPHNWHPVVFDLPSLESKVWLGGGCIEFYLLLHWMKNRDRSVLWYLSSSAVAVLSQPDTPPEEDITRIRNQLQWRQGDSMRPVAFLVCSSQHWFCVVLDYSKDAVSVFGRSIKKSGVRVVELSDWDNWHGHHIWKNAAAIYGWQQPDSPPSRVFHINWLQVGL